MDRYSLKERVFLVLSMKKNNNRTESNTTKSLGMKRRPPQQQLKGNKQVW